MMNNYLKNALTKRRTHYALTASSPISDEEIIGFVKDAVMHVPSAFNSQSARIVVLFGDNHKKLWEITKQKIKEITSEESYKNSELKINNCFAAGYGTILFFEDQETIENLQSQFPTYKDNFPVWSDQASGMHQWVIWAMLKENGLGASLQHYNPLIDEDVKNTWNLNPKWKLVAQMPFGTPVDEPGEKQFNPLEDRILVF